MQERGIIITYCLLFHVCMDQMELVKEVVALPIANLHVSKIFPMARNVFQKTKLKSGKQTTLV